MISNQESKVRTLTNLCLLYLLFTIPVCHAQPGDPILEQGAGMMLAQVSIHEKLKEQSRPKPRPKTRSISKVIPHKVEQYEIEGYMDKKYVRVVLEVENKDRIVGNIYDKAGKGIYVHGEYQEDALYVYDDEGTEYNIVID